MAASSLDTLHNWLISEEFTSTRQARLHKAYVLWLNLVANPLALAGLLVVLALVLIATFAPLLANHDPIAQDLTMALKAPSATNWFGTDEFGRDVYSRLVYGARTTLYISILVTVIVAPIGFAIGATAGYLGGWVDVVLMRITDIFLSFPSLVLALAFSAALGPGIENAVIAIALTVWPPIARLARAETMTFRQADFVVAAELQGAGMARILFRHIVPLCAPSIIIRLTLNMSSVILTAAGLGFLGLGAQPPMPEWGAMAASGRQYLLDAWWLTTVPALPFSLSALPSIFLVMACAILWIHEMLDQSQPILEVENMSVEFPTLSGVVTAVKNVSFKIGREKVGIIGESGSGKSTTGRAIMKLQPSTAVVKADRLRFEDVDLLKTSEADMRAIRGRRISMILQDPKYSLNPVMTVGEQIAETVILHEHVSKRQARERTLAMLERVNIREPQRVFDLYPHEVSGGMGQRIMISMMLISSPQLIIADEPTSALDVTVRQQVLSILDDLITERDIGLVFISHDLNLVKSFCDRVIIMYSGRIVETIEASKLDQARHPYTRGLLEALPSLDRPRDRLEVLKRDPSWVEI